MNLNNRAKRNAIFVRIAVLTILFATCFRFLAAQVPAAPATTANASENPAVPAQGMRSGHSRLALYFRG